jgi:hypothetical protein
MGNRLICRARKEAAEKAMRAMVKRIDALYTMGREGRLRVPLEKPVFWGYRRELILRPDVARRQDAEGLLVLLRTVQKLEDSKRKDFKVFDKQRRRWADWHHTPRKLAPRVYDALRPDLKCHFHWTWTPWKGSRYEITHNWMYASRRSKLYLTHRFIPNVEVEQELSYLKARMEQDMLWEKYRHVKSRKTTREWPWDTSRRKLRSQMLAQEIREGLEVHACGQLCLERGKEVICDA